MDIDGTAILAIVSVIISAGGTVLAIFNHQRCRSNCFGKKLELSIDIERTTPPGEKLNIKIPAEKSETKLDVV